jgi:Flp pilus assembly pilin Flp
MLLVMGFGAVIAVVFVGTGAGFVGYLPNFFLSITDVLFYYKYRV